MNPSKLMGAQMTEIELAVFTNIQKFIMCVNEDLINRFHIIQQIISLGLNSIFRNFNSTPGTLSGNSSTWWYFMPTAMHKILTHGLKIVIFLMPPIGQIWKAVSIIIIVLHVYLT